MHEQRDRLADRLVERRGGSELLGLAVEACS